MKVIFLYLFFLTTCGCAQETSLPHSANNNLLDVNKLPFAEENHVPNPDDGDTSNNVEDLQGQLIAERAKNRDLNQTISDILERMEDMEKNIMRNEEKITAVQADVGTNQGAITEIQGDVVAVQDDVIVVAADVERNSADITTLATMGHWCGFREDQWNTVGTITYKRITFSASNMNITGTPLDINTGIITTVTSVIIIWILIFVTFQGSSLCLCLEHGD